MTVCEAHVMSMDGDEAGAYAKFGPTGATDHNYRYGNLKVFKFIMFY